MEVRQQLEALYAGTLSKGQTISGDFTHTVREQEELDESVSSVQMGFATQGDQEKFYNFILDDKFRKQLFTAQSSTQSLKRFMKAKGIKGEFTVGGTVIAPPKKRGKSEPEKEFSNKGPHGGY